ncbi:MAG: class I SAM-dependent methyltransferase [Acidobacteria bacterium]|nr:class I SAM-dependent methyltransferase [Acidobacteriota bacterium]
MADPPSAFIEAWVARYPVSGRRPARALDVAMGRGRHAALLAAAGYATFGVDISLDAVRDARRHTPQVRAWCADLTGYRLPRACFALVVVARYLQRDLFGAIQDAVTPGGIVLYETFTVAQRQLGRGPASPDHLLDAGELRARFGGFELLFYEEVAAPDDPITGHLPPDD